MALRKRVHQSRNAHALSTRAQWTYLLHSRPVGDGHRDDRIAPVLRRQGGRYEDRRIWRLQAPSRSRARRSNNGQQPLHFSAMTVVYDGNGVKSSLVATHVFFIPFVSLLFFGIVIWKLPSLAVAQSTAQVDVQHDTPGQLIKPGQSVHVDVDLALVNVTVTDPYDRLVTGLEPDNFRIFENSVEQEIQYFSSEDIPISIGVIFDLSGSMANKVDKAREAASQFFKTANPQDEFFLVSFNERAELMSGFTSSVEDLQNRILSAPARGRTALLDAIYLGLNQMRTARNAKRALLILSDGGDNNSRYT